MKYGPVFNSFGELFNAMTLPSAGTTVVAKDKQVQKPKSTSGTSQTLSSIPGYMATMEKRKKDK